MGLALGGCPWTPDPCLPPQCFPMGTPSVLEVEIMWFWLTRQSKVLGTHWCVLLSPMSWGLPWGGREELEVPGCLECWWWGKQDHPGEHQHP